MQKAYTLYTTQFFDANYWIAQAILWHDIGKIYCKTFISRHFLGTGDIKNYETQTLSITVHLVVASVRLFSFARIRKFK
jgi:hypothetical protein